MEDAKIIDLYFARDEKAISATGEKYGRYCFSIANRFLQDYEDANECVNDTWLGAWNAIPPQRPGILSAFLGKITRNLSLKKWRDKNAKKRGSGEAALTFDELEECIPDQKSIDEHLAAKELAELLNAFLGELGKDERQVFVCRYWYCDSISEISLRFGFGESKVKMMLKRTRDKLQARLGEEGIFV